MTAMKKPSVLIALLFGVIVPGLGFLYLGRLRLAFLIPVSHAFLIAIFAWTRLIFEPAMLVVMSLILVAVYIISIVAVAILVPRQAAASRSCWQRWYVYLTYIVITLLSYQFLTQYRGRIFGYETFRLPSASMMDTLLPGDYVLSDTWKYRDRGPQRGEIVVYKDPRNPANSFVKRVIGLPGDIVCFNGTSVIVNNVKLDEPYVSPANNVKQTTLAEVRIPDGQYFMLGDNRDSSNDSRFQGPIPAKNISGSVESIWMSLDDKMHIRPERIVEHPQ
jgi:signal peptidase I